MCARKLLLSFAACLLLCCAADPPDDTAIAVAEQGVHNALGCAIANLGVGAGQAMANSYGRWCGATNVGPGTPVNCWDNACRAHDYAFHGPRGSGQVSCHDVINRALCAAHADPACAFGAPTPGAAPDSDCIRAADQALCAGWTQCTAEAEAAMTTWTQSTAGRGVRVRACVDPSAGNRGRAERCPWYEHRWFGASQVWTCGACPAAPPEPPALSNPACAVAQGLSQADQLRQCCGDYAGSLRPDVCECPASRPVRVKLAFPQTYTVECRACPNDEPYWSESRNSCQACPDDAPRWNAVDEACEACPAATPIWNPATGRCEPCPAAPPWPSECGCTPRTCEEAGATCGAVDDGCGGLLDCGACTAPQTCGGAGVPNQCGCAALTCAAAGANCGSLPDRCGGVLDCGACTAPQSCGGAGVPNQCGCAQATCTPEPACTPVPPRFKLTGSGILAPSEGYATASAACMSGGPYHDTAYGAPSCHRWSYPGSAGPLSCAFFANQCGGDGELLIAAQCPAGYALSPDLTACVQTVPRAPQARITVEGTCNLYRYDGPEGGLSSHFSAFWSAHSACPGTDCGSISVSQDISANTISWSWQHCGSATRTYEERPCPNGYSPAGDVCVCD